MVEASQRPRQNKFVQKLGSQIDVPVWRCSSCKGVLATTDKERSTIRLKYKDFYCHVSNGGKVTVACRRCGELNTVITLAIKDSNKDV